MSAFCPQNKCMGFVKHSKQWLFVYTALVGKVYLAGKHWVLCEAATESEI